MHFFFSCLGWIVNFLAFVMILLSSILFEIIVCFCHFGLLHGEERVILKSDFKKCTVMQQQQNFNVIKLLIGAPDSNKALLLKCSRSV